MGAPDTTYATPEDVTDAWLDDKAPIPSDAKLTRYLERAARMIRNEVPGIQARLDAGNEPDLQGNLMDVSVAMVMRLASNPRGLRFRQHNTGPFGESETFIGDKLGVLFLDPTEADLLRGKSTKGKAFTIAVDGGTRYRAVLDTGPSW